MLNYLNFINNFILAIALNYSMVWEVSFIGFMEPICKHLENKYKSKQACLKILFLHQ